jgi:EAL domain-containing protein (putative c-di-GMP-specific phosphodiesterase class I)
VQGFLLSRPVPLASLMALAGAQEAMLR